MLRMEHADHVAIAAVAIIIAFVGIVRSDWSELMAIHIFEMWNLSFSALKIPLEFKWVLIFDWCLLRTDKLFLGELNQHCSTVNGDELINRHSFTVWCHCASLRIYLCPFCRSTGYDDCPVVRQHDESLTCQPYEHPNFQRNLCRRNWPAAYLRRLAGRAGGHFTTLSAHKING